MWKIALIVAVFGCLQINHPVSAVFTSTGCGETKGCFQLPSGCSPSDASCLFFSWIWNATANQFSMELSGKAGSGNTYTAIAFGRAQAMANADLYYCTGDALKTGAIQGEKSTPATLALASYPEIQAQSASSADSIAQCTFTRPASVTKPVSSGTQVFDLTSGTFWLMIASGAASSTSISYHDTSRAFSSAQVNMTAISAAGAGVGADPLDKVHGGLMIAAWLFLVNLGIIIARHFKPIWPNSTACGEKVWFQMHRTVMLLVVGITIAAFVIIFVEVGGYGADIGAHAIIGIVVMILALLNPIIALFRCHPNTPRRPIFYWVHWFVGLSARTLGLANLFIGVGLVAIGLPKWTVSVLGGFTGYQVLFEIIFEIVTWQSHTKKTDEPTPDSTLQVEEPNVRVRGQKVKIILLAVYIVGSLCFATSLWVAIGNA